MPEAYAAPPCAMLHLARFVSPQLCGVFNASFSPDRPPVSLAVMYLKLLLFDMR